MASQYTQMAQDDLQDGEDGPIRGHLVAQSSFHEIVSKTAKMARDGLDDC